MWRLALTFFAPDSLRNFSPAFFLSGRQGLELDGHSVDGKLVQYAVTPFLSFLSVWVRPQPDLQHGQAFDTLSKNICLTSLYLHNLVKYQIIHSKLRQRMCSTSFDMDEFLRQIFFSDTFVFLRSVLESLLKRGNRVILACNDSTIGEMEQERLRWFPRYFCVTAHIKPLIKYEGGFPNILVVEHFQLTLSCTQNLKLWCVNGWYHE